MKKIWSKRMALTAMAALVASMSMGAAVVGAEPGKGKGNGNGNGAEAKIEAQAKVEAKVDAKVQAKVETEAEAEVTVKDDVYGGDEGSKGNHGKGNKHGLENALLNLEDKPSKDKILEILADRTVNAEELAVALEAEGEVEAAVVAQEEAVALSPADAKLVKKLAKLLVKAGKTEMKAFVNGKQPDFDVVPFVKEGRTLVPFRAIAASLNAEVSYDSATQTVTVVRGEVTVELTLGSDAAYINGVAVKLDVAAESVEGRTVIPLRFLAEAFDANVEFDAETQSVIITEKVEVAAKAEAAE